jgi:hypothetical protein
VFSNKNFTRHSCSHSAQAHYAIRGVSNAAHKSYSSQAFALDAFNKVVGWGGVEVVCN